MKKIGLVLTVLLSLFSASSFAYVNNKSVNQQLIYCPEKIECKSLEKYISCSVIGNHLQYWWGASNPWEPNPVGMPVGEYDFYQASATYHHKGLINATC